MQSLAALAVAGNVPASLHRSQHLYERSGYQAWAFHIYEVFLPLSNTDTLKVMNSDSLSQALT